MMSRVSKRLRSSHRLTEESIASGMGPARNGSRPPHAQVGSADSGSDPDTSRLVMRHKTPVAPASANADTPEPVPKRMRASDKVEEGTSASFPFQGSSGRQTGLGLSVPRQELDRLTARYSAPLSGTSVPTPLFTADPCSSLGLRTPSTIISWTRTSFSHFPPHGPLMVRFPLYGGGSQSQSSPSANATSSSTPPPGTGLTVTFLFDDNQTRTAHSASGNPSSSVQNASQGTGNPPKSDDEQSPPSTPMLPVGSLITLGSIGALEIGFGVDAPLPRWVAVEGSESEATTRQPGDSNDEQQTALQSQDALSIKPDPVSSDSKNDSGPSGRQGSNQQPGGSKDEQQPQAQQAQSNGPNSNTGSDIKKLPPQQLRWSFEAGPPDRSGGLTEDQLRDYAYGVLEEVLSHVYTRERLRDYIVGVDSSVQKLASQAEDPLPPPPPETDIQIPQRVSPRQSTINGPTGQPAQSPNPNYDFSDSCRPPVAARPNMYAPNATPMHPLIVRLLERVKGDLFRRPALATNSTGTETVSGSSRSKQRKNPDTLARTTKTVRGKTTRKSAAKQSTKTSTNTGTKTTTGAKTRSQTSGVTKTAAKNTPSRLRQGASQQLLQVGPPVYRKQSQQEEEPNQKQGTHRIQPLAGAPPKQLAEMALQAARVPSPQQNNRKPREEVNLLLLQLLEGVVDQGELQRHNRHQLQLQQQTEAEAEAELGNGEEREDFESEAEERNE